MHQLSLVVTKFMECSDINEEWFITDSGTEADAATKTHPATDATGETAGDAFGGTGAECADGD